MIDRRLNLFVPSSSGTTAGRFEMMGTLSASLNQAHGRLIIVRVCFTLAYLVIAIRAFDLMALQGTFVSFHDDRMSEPALSSIVAKPRRDIVDRNGVLLATSIKTASLYADPQVMIEPEQTARDLARIFPDQNYGDLVQKFDRKRRFIWIKRNITPAEQVAVLELGQPGLSFQEEYRRLYPQGPLTAHLIGYTGIDSQGLGGIEQEFDPLLKREGDALTLSLDIRLQHILRREIQKTMNDFTASGGAGMIMDIQNGDVLAAVSLPDFDPHNPGTASDSERFNRVSLGTYELGSVFKIFTTAALIEQKNISMKASYDARTPLHKGRYTISDYHPENRSLTVPEVFMLSSNIGTARMAEQIGTEGLQNFFSDLGLLKPAIFDLPEIGKPLVPNPWRDISTLTASYGHGIAITPLQLVAATASIIGDGTMVQPRLVPINEKKKRTPSLRVVSPETAQKMRALLRLVVLEGTGKKADIPGLMVGGKTGTAEKSINGRYVGDALISSFIGAFPMDNPRYAVFVMIDDPKPNKSSFGYATAGWTATPAVGHVISGLANIYGLLPDTNRQEIAAPLQHYLAKYTPATATPSSLAGDSSLASVTPVPR